MKNVFKVSLLAATVAITVGCNQTGAVDVDFDNENQKTAYAIGSSLSQYVDNTLTKQAAYGVELDKEILLQGFSDAIREKGKLTEDEVLTTLKAYDTKMQEVAKAFDVNTSLVRFWEKEFDVIKPKKNAKGNRLFTQEDIKNFKLIFNLVKERGFTLDGAKQKLKKNPEGIFNNQEIITRLEGVKAELQKIKNSL